MMESNGGGIYLDGWGMSIATKRAKERRNRTPDVKVMAKTVKHGKLKLQGPDVRGEKAGCPGHCPGAGCPGFGRISGALCPESLPF